MDILYSLIDTDEKYFNIVNSKDSFMNWSKNIYLNPKYFKRYMKIENKKRE
jgi:hypothetical protein